MLAAVANTQVVQKELNFGAANRRHSVAGGGGNWFTKSGLFNSQDSSRISDKKIAFNRVLMILCTIALDDEYLTYEQLQGVEGSLQKGMKENAARRIVARWRMFVARKQLTDEQRAKVERVIQNLRRCRERTEAEAMTIWAITVSVP